MKIAIDIDEVITETVKKFLEFYKIKTGQIYIKEDLHSYDYWKTLPSSRKEIKNLFDEFYNTKFFDSISPVKDSINILHKLFQYHELILITSRPIRYKEKTEKWFKKYIPELIDKIIYPGDYFAKQAVTKASVCKNQGIPLIIEDHVKYALECAHAGITVILLDKPWNKKASHENIIRVKDWSQILIEINKLSQNF